MALASVPSAEWIEWAGGLCPLPVGHLFHLRYRDGVESRRPRIAEGVWASVSVWLHRGDQSDIVAYRVVPA